MSGQSPSESSQLILRLREASLSRTSHFKSIAEFWSIFISLSPLSPSRYKNWPNRMNHWEREEILLVHILLESVTLKSLRKNKKDCDWTHTTHVPSLASSWKELSRLKLMIFSQQNQFDPLLWNRNKSDPVQIFHKFCKIYTQTPIAHQLDWPR